MPAMNLPGPKARALIKRDQAVISPSYPRGYPFVMDHGRGTEVWDVDNNRFLDFAAGIAGIAIPPSSRPFRSKPRNSSTFLRTFTTRSGLNWARN